MKTLHLNLKRNWFNMIHSGAKPEEYRELTNYWFKRLFDKYITEADTGKKYDNSSTYAALAHNSDLIQTSMGIKPIDFDTVTFSNGYAKDRDQFVIELKGIEITTGEMVWGAQLRRKYFVLKLGEILNQPEKLM